MTAAGNKAARIVHRHGLHAPKAGIWRLAVTATLCIWIGSTLGGSQASAAPTKSAVASTLQLEVTASPSRVVTGQVYANVNLAGGTSPTGTLTFRLFGPNDPNCMATAVFTSTVAVVGTSVTSDHYTTVTAGSYQWEASYSGDSQNSPVGPTACSSPSSAVVVSKQAAYQTITAGQPVGGTIAASVALSGDNPSGTLTFTLTAPGDTFCSTAIFTSTVAAKGTGTYQSAPYTWTAAGQYRWRVAYSGDVNNIAALTSCLDTGDPVTVTAPPAPPPPPPPPPTSASLSSPVNGQSQVASTAPFTWQAIPQAQGYLLTIGSTDGSWDVLHSGQLPSSQTSLTPPALPAGNLYAVLYTLLNNVWSSSPHVAFTAAPSEAGLTSPTSSQANVATTSSFSWSTIAGSQGYLLWLGTVPGIGNLYSSPLLPATQASVTPPALPAGKTIYVTLSTERNGVFTDQAATITTAAT